MLWVLKIVSPETLHAFAKTLVTYHQPVEPPKISLALHDSPLSAAHPSTTVGACSTRAPSVQPSGVAPLRNTNASSPQICHSCSGPITPAEINFCKAHPARFAGKDLCRSCQKFAPPAKKSSAPIAPKKLELNPSHPQAPSGPIPPSQSSPQSCQTCSGPLAPAEVLFCKDREARFGGKLLCRRCQASQFPTKNPKLKTQNSAEHSLQSRHSQPQPQNPSVRITIAPRAPQPKPHSQNPAPGPVQASPADNAQTQTWEERYNEIKIAHPRAYEEWTPSEEAKLIELFKSRTPIRSIAQTLDRQPGGIRARLKRLNLLEPSKGRTVTGI